MFDLGWMSVIGGIGTKIENLVLIFGYFDD